MTRLRSGRGAPVHALRDRVFVAAIGLIMLGSAALFIWLLLDIIIQGVQELPAAWFAADSLLLAASWSTLLLLTIALVTAIPLAMATALCLTELPLPTTLRRSLRLSLDTLAGVPSIVFGLFGQTVFCDLLGLGYSILAGGLTLACMILPLTTSLFEDSLRRIPSAHRQAAAAVGLSRASTIYRIIIPAALPGLIAGVILGLGRAIAETAALIFTSGSAPRSPGSLLDPGRSLAVHIYETAMHVPGGTGQAYAAAITLVAMLTVISIGTLFLERWWRKRLGQAALT